MYFSSLESSIMFLLLLVVVVVVVLDVVVEMDVGVAGDFRLGVELFSVTLTCVLLPSPSSVDKVASMAVFL